MNNYKNIKAAIAAILFATLKLCLTPEFSFDISSILYIVVACYIMYILFTRVVPKLEKRTTLLERIEYNANTFLWYLLVSMTVMLCIQIFICMCLFDFDSGKFYWNRINILLMDTFNIAPDYLIQICSFVVFVYLIFTISAALLVTKFMDVAIPYFGVMREHKEKFNYKVKYFIPLFFIFIIVLIPSSMISKINLQIGLLAITSMIPLVVQFVIKGTDKYLFDIDTFGELIRVQKIKYLKSSISNPSKYYLMGLLFLVFSVLYFKCLFIFQKKILALGCFNVVNDLGLLIWITGWVLFLASITTFYYIADQVFNNDFITTSSLMWCERNKALYSNLLISKETFEAIHKGIYGLEVKIIDKAGETEIINDMPIDDYCCECGLDDFNIVYFEIPVDLFTRNINKNVASVSYICKCYCSDIKSSSNEFIITVKRFGPGLTFIEIVEDLQKVNILGVNKSKFGFKTSFSFILDNFQ